jgi:hypothetical protein
LVIIFTLVLVQSTFARFQTVPADYKISHLNIEPSGTLTSGTPVFVSFEVTFPILSGQTFPPGNDLGMRTDLANPRWNYTLVLDGKEKTPVSSEERMLDISGFDLSYLSNTDESIYVTLEGTAPDVNEITNKTVIDIYEIGSCCEIYPEDIQTVLVINTTELEQKKSDAKKILRHSRPISKKKMRSGSIPQMQK